MNLPTILGLLIGIPSAVLAIVKIGGWARGHLQSSSSPTWQDFVNDIQSLEGASEIHPNKEDRRIALKYSRSERQFHRQTRFDYEILDFQVDLLMVEPLD